MAAETWPLEVHSLGRTLKNWRDEIIAWHRSKATNGPTEAANNLVERVKCAAFGFRSFRNFRIRSLLYAGRPDWYCSRRSHPTDSRRAGIHLQALDKPRS
jgi:Transposase